MSTHRDRLSRRRRFHAPHRTVSVDGLRNTVTKLKCGALVETPASLNPCGLYSVDKSCRPAVVRRYGDTPSCDQ
jgi:hypothetical protein